MPIDLCGHSCHREKRFCHQKCRQFRHWTSPSAIIDLIRLDSAVPTDFIATSLNISKRTVLRRLEELKERGRINRMGPSKSGCWEVVE
ncbi:MAG: HTH domain-containing protein [Desulfovibrio sp.]|nr:HTH domain-containing protein [Desulfovibrio sp.]